MIDSHTHIFEPEFDEDRREVLERACGAGVEHLILPNIDVESLPRLLKTHEDFPHNTSIAIGLHPTSVGEDFPSQLEVIHEAVRKYRSKVVAIGEVGLDFYWDRSFVREQEEVLRTQVEWAIEEDLPLILHTRSAHREMLDLLSAYRGEERLRGVFHSFTGSEEELEELIAFSPSFMIGINGVVTFKKSTLREYIARIPLDRILLETDAPYLAPVPHRGKRNEPSFLPETLAEVARAFGLFPAQLEEAISANSRQLFALEKI